MLLKLSETNHRYNKILEYNTRVSSVRVLNLAYILKLQTKMPIQMATNLLCSNFLSFCKGDIFGGNT